MDHGERERFGRDRNDAGRASEEQRALDHFKRELFFGEHQDRGGPVPSGMFPPTAADERFPRGPAMPRTKEPRESRNEREVREARQLCKMWHVFNHWHRMKLETKLRALMKIERELARLQGRPSVVGIRSFRGPHVNRGAYYPEKNRIALNVSVLRRRSWRMAIRVYLHEARHAYQYHVINHPNNHPEVSTARQLVWKTAARLYPSLPERNPTYLQELAYLLNFLETEARAYVNRQIKRIIKEFARGA